MSGGLQVTVFSRFSWNLIKVFALMSECGKIYTDNFCLKTRSLGQIFVHFKLAMSLIGKEGQIILSILYLATLNGIIAPLLGYSSPSLIVPVVSLLACFERPQVAKTSRN